MMQLTCLKRIGFDEYAEKVYHCKDKIEMDCLMDSLLWQAVRKIQRSNEITKPETDPHWRSRTFILRVNRRRAKNHVKAGHSVLNRKPPPERA